MPASRWTRSSRLGHRAGAAFAAVATLAGVAVGTGGEGRSDEAAPSSTASTLAPPPLVSGPSPIARPIGSEPTVEHTTPPAIAQLALAYQPTVRMSVADRFWPVSVAGVLREQGEDRFTCIVVPPGDCAPGPPPPAIAQLTASAPPAAYMDYPAPVNSVHDQFVAYARALGLSPQAIAAWRTDPAGLQPYASAQIYFYYGGHVVPPYPGLPAGRAFVSLQYWFFYPLNYFPSVVLQPRHMLTDPIAANHGNLDYHEGDWEHITVLLDPESLAPAYLWMARHSSEGVAVPWSRVVLDRGHPVIYPALGGHPSYQACGIHRRPKLLKLVSDYVVCEPGLFEFDFEATPLVDLSYVPWACWPGHFGEAGPGLRTATGRQDPTKLYLVAGPSSPLRQAENSKVCT